MRAAITKTRPNDSTGEKAASQYELSMLGSTKGWQAGPGYVNWLQRFDGLRAYRRSLLHYGMYQNIDLINDADFFETLLYRRGVFLGVSVLRRLSPRQAEITEECKLNFQASPLCPAAFYDFAAEAEASIAVHLATFPIG